MFCCPSSREAAGLEHHMAKMTERRCGKFLHFLKNGVNETKIIQKCISIEVLETLALKNIFLLLWSKRPTESNKWPQIFYLRNKPVM